MTLYRFRAFFAGLAAPEEHAEVLTALKNPKILLLDAALFNKLSANRSERQLFSGPAHIFFSPGATQPIVGVYFTALYRALASSRKRLLDHTQRRATVGRTPLNE